MVVLKIKAKEQENQVNILRIKVAKTVSAIDTYQTKTLKVFKVI